MSATISKEEFFKEVKRLSTIQSENKLSKMEKANLCQYYTVNVNQRDEILLTLSCCFSDGEDDEDDEAKLVYLRGLIQTHGMV